MHPCFRSSPGRTRRRRSHHALKKINVTSCPNCGAARRPHSACKSCGYTRPGLQLRSIASE